VHDLNPKYISFISALYDVNQHMDPGEDKQQAVTEMLTVIGEGLPKVVNDEQALKLAGLFREGCARYELLTSRTSWDGAVPMETLTDAIDILKNYR
jgi:hypothetical protein